MGEGGGAQREEGGEGTIDRCLCHSIHTTIPPVNDQLTTHRVGRRGVGMLVGGGGGGGGGNRWGGWRGGNGEGGEGIVGGGGGQRRGARMRYATK